MRYAIRSVFKNPGILGNCDRDAGGRDRTEHRAVRHLQRDAVPAAPGPGSWTAGRDPLRVHDPGRAARTPDLPRLRGPSRAARRPLGRLRLHAGRHVGLSGAERRRARTGRSSPPNMFDVLGVPARIQGRTFAATDAKRADRRHLATRSWQRVFGADESVVGRSVTINGRPFTIIGITPRGFTGSGPLRTVRPLDSARRAQSGHAAGRQRPLAGELVAHRHWTARTGRQRAAG